MVSIAFAARQSRGFSVRLLFRLRHIGFFAELARIFVDIAAFGRLAGIFAREAADTIIRFAVAGKQPCVLNAQETEGIEPEFANKFLIVVFVCNQLLPRGNIRAEIAGEQEFRRGGAHMHLRCARFTQKADDTLDCCSANDGIIDKHNALAADRCGYGVELDSNEFFTLVLFRLNEGSADIFVFDKAYAVGNAGLS